MGLTEALGAWTDGRGPLYERLAHAIRTAVARRDIHPGSKLPPERHLAALLTVSRSTVVAAYDLLRNDGTLESRQGAGTWVRAHDGAPLSVDAPREVGNHPLFRTLLECRTDTIGFTVGCPEAVSFVPRTLAAVARDEAPELMRTTGYKPMGLTALREQVAQMFTDDGVPTQSDQILITAGAQQAIVLTALGFLRPGDTALVEEATFPGALDAFTLAGARVASIAMDDAGARADSLRDALARTNARLVYLIPSFHNPTGITMPETRRREILRVARESGIPVVDDTTLADIVLDDRPRPLPLAASGDTDAVVTVGSISKLFWGGLRVGWIRAPDTTITRLARLKTALDLGSPLIDQAVAARLLPLRARAVAERRAGLAPRLAHLAELLREHLPDWRFAMPSGGLFVWAQIPRGDATEFAQVALREGVEIVPGTAMSPDGGHRDRVRLPFLVPEPALEEGIRRLGAAWRAYAPEPRRARASVEVLV